MHLMRWVQGAAASGPPQMENPRPRELRWISTSKVLVRSEKVGRGVVGSPLLSLLLPPRGYGWEVSDLRTGEGEVR